MLKTRHKKLYDFFGTGVVLTCGNIDIVASATGKDSNFMISNCPKCGMEVQTIGTSPETNKVMEWQRN